MTHAPIFHLAPAAYYHAQPIDQPYWPATFAAEGFIHCTAGTELLLEIANTFFADLAGDLLALEINPHQLTSPLKFEPPIPPPGVPAGLAADVLFPHIYGPLNRTAITRIVPLRRDPANRWQFPVE